MYLTENHWVDSKIVTKEKIVDVIAKLVKFITLMEVKTVNDYSWNIFHDECKKELISFNHYCPPKQGSTADVPDKFKGWSVIWGNELVISSFCFETYLSIKDFNAGIFLFPLTGLVNGILIKSDTVDGFWEQFQIVLTNKYPAIIDSNNQPG